MPGARIRQEAGTPNHTRRWRILLEKLNLPVYNNRGTPPSVPQLKVRVISDYNFEDENPSD